MSIVRINMLFSFIQGAAMQ